MVRYLAYRINVYYKFSQGGAGGRLKRQKYGAKKKKGAFIYLFKNEAVVSMYVGCYWCWNSVLRCEVKAWWLLLLVEGSLRRLNKLLAKVCKVHLCLLFRGTESKC